VAYSGETVTTRRDPRSFDLFQRLSEDASKGYRIRDCDFLQLASISKLEVDRGTLFGSNLILVFYFLASSRGIDDQRERFGKDLAYLAKKLDGIIPRNGGEFLDPKKRHRSIDGRELRSVLFATTQNNGYINAALELV
jgi:hypothetical protein